MDSKKKALDVVKDVAERKQVVSRLIYGTINKTTQTKLTASIDIPFNVGRIVCDNVVWSGTPGVTEYRFAIVKSTLFGGEAICAFNDAYQYYDSKSGQDSTSGSSQTFSNAEVVYGSPQKIRGTYVFPLSTVAGDQETGMVGSIAIMLKFYEF